MPYKPYAPYEPNAMFGSDWPAFAEKYRKEHPEEFDANGEPLAKAGETDPNMPLPDQKPMRDGSYDWKRGWDQMGQPFSPGTGSAGEMAEPDTTPLDPGWADEWQRMWKQQDQKGGGLGQGPIGVPPDAKYFQPPPQPTLPPSNGSQFGVPGIGNPQKQMQIPPPPPPGYNSPWSNKPQMSDASGLIDPRILGGGGQGLLPGGSGMDTLEPQADPGMLAGFGLLPPGGDTGAEGANTLPGGAGRAMPADDGSNPNFLSRIFGGGNRNKLGIGMSNIGAMLMASAGGDTAKGAQALQQGGALFANERAQQSEDQARKAALAMRQRELDKPAEGPAGVQEYNFAVKNGYKGDYVQFQQDKSTSGSDNTSAVKNALALGYKPGSDDFNKFVYDQAIKPSTQIEMKAEGAYDTAGGQEAMKQQVEVNKSIAGSRAKMKTLDLMGKIAANPKVYQGPGGEQVAELKRIGQTLGYKMEGADEATLLQALTNQLALKARNPAGGEGMPGSLSNQDRDFLVSQIPGITKTAGGNLLLVDVMRRIETRNIDENRERVDYLRTHRNPDGLEDHMQDWADKQPNLFDDLSTSKAEDNAGVVHDWQTYKPGG